MTTNTKLVLSEEEILSCLDSTIRFWRGWLEGSGSSNQEDKTMVLHYIDAYQSMRKNFFGETLPGRTSEDETTTNRYGLRISSKMKSKKIDDKVQPISPSEVRKTLPDVAILVFNELICKYWDGDCAEIPGMEVMAAIKEAANVDFNTQIKLGLLDIGSIYESAGWKVSHENKDAVAGLQPPKFIFCKQGTSNENHSLLRK